MTVGLSLRKEHLHEIMVSRPSLPFFEVLIENYLHEDSPLLRQLLDIREYYSLFAHGTGLSIGSVDPLNAIYLTRVKTLLERLAIDVYSDHLAFVSHNGEYFPELFPLPYTNECLAHVARRVDAVQAFLKRPLLLENISSYVTPGHHDMTEAEFLTALCVKTGCKIWLDINNIYVSCCNHGWLVAAYLDALKAEHIAGYHLGGYDEESGVLIDTHGQDVDAKVWTLFAEVIQRFGKRPVIIERDQRIPELSALLIEVEKARAICH